jgi:hypothetical protein
MIPCEQQFKKKELQHLMVMLNEYGNPNCQECSDLRKKIEKLIAEYPAITLEWIGGENGILAEIDRSK